MLPRALTEVKELLDNRRISIFDVFENASGLMDARPDLVGMSDRKAGKMVSIHEVVFMK
jgi:hypothetical protein